MFVYDTIYLFVRHTNKYFSFRRCDPMPDEYHNPSSGHKAIPSGIEFKVFDPRDPATGSGGAELSDACVLKRGNQWWMYLAGQAKGYGATDLYSASLPPDAQLTAQS
jgi:hypothetical protein